MANEMVGMRLSPAARAQVDELRDKTRLSTGQALMELCDFQNRISRVADRFRIGVERDGSKMVYICDPETSEVLDVVEGSDVEELLFYILAEMDKSFMHSFRSFDGYLSISWGIES